MNFTFFRENKDDFAGYYSCYNNHPSRHKLHEWSLADGGCSNKSSWVS